MKPGSKSWPASMATSRRGRGRPIGRVDGSYCVSRAHFVKCPAILVRINPQSSKTSPLALPRCAGLPAGPPRRRTEEPQRRAARGLAGPSRRATEPPAEPPRTAWPPLLAVALAPPFATPLQVTPPRSGCTLRVRHNA